MIEFVHKTKIQSIALPSQYFQDSTGGNISINLPQIELQRTHFNLLFAGVDNIMDVDVEIRFIPRKKENKV